MLEIWLLAHTLSFIWVILSVLFQILIAVVSTVAAFWLVDAFASMVQRLCKHKPTLRLYYFSWRLRLHWRLSSSPSCTRSIIKLFYLLRTFVLFNSVLSNKNEKLALLLISLAYLWWLWFASENLKLNRIEYRTHLWLPCVAPYHFTRFTNSPHGVLLSPDETVNADFCKTLALFARLQFLQIYTTFLQYDVRTLWLYIRNYVRSFWL